MTINWMPWFAAIVLFFGTRWRIGLMAGLFAELIYVGGRGLILGRLPLIGPHDTLLFFALSLAAMGLFMSFSPILRGVRWFTVAAGLSAGSVTLL
ncbi:MAG: cytochrome C biogenesis protein ResC, partial [Pseudomonadota bacterium]